MMLSLSLLNNVQISINVVNYQLFIFKSLLNLLLCYNNDIYNNDIEM